MVLVLVSANQPNKTKPIYNKEEHKNPHATVEEVRILLYIYLAQPDDRVRRDPNDTAQGTPYALFLVLKILLLHSVRLPSVPLDSHLILGRLRLHILGTVGLLLRSSTVDSLAFPCAFT